MTTAIRCPSRNPVEICCVLGFSSGRDGLTVIDGCGYCDNTGQCHYRGKLHREECREHKEPEDRRKPRERKERRKPGRVQVSLHIFLRGGGA